MEENKSPQTEEFFEILIPEDVVPRGEVDLKATLFYQPGKTPLLEPDPEDVESLKSTEELLDSTEKALRTLLPLARQKTPVHSTGVSPLLKSPVETPILQEKNNRVSTPEASQSDGIPLNRKSPPERPEGIEEEDLAETPQEEPFVAPASDHPASPDEDTALGRSLSDDPCPTRIAPSDDETLVGGRNLTGDKMALAMEESSSQGPPPPLRPGTVLLPKLRNSFNGHDNPVDTVRSRARDSIKASLSSGIQTLLSIVGALSLITLAGYGIIHYNSSGNPKKNSYPNSLSMPISQPPEKIAKIDPPKKVEGKGLIAPPKEKPKPEPKEKPKAKIPVPKIPAPKLPVPKPKEVPKKEKFDPLEFKPLWKELNMALERGIHPVVPLSALLEKAKDDPAESQKYYELAAREGSGEAMSYLGKQAFSNGKEKEAEKYLKGAIQRGYKNPSPYNNLALLYLQQGKEKEAQNLLNQAQKKKLKSPELLNSLGNFSRRQGNLDKAVEYYREALKIDSLFYPAYYNLAETLLLQGELEEAFKHYQTLASAPDKELALLGWNGLGKIHFFREKYTDAEKAFETALSLGIKPPSNLVENLAISYARTGKAEEALKIFAKIKNPTPGIQYNHAMVLTVLKKYNKARDLLQRVLKKNPKFKEARFNLALINEAQGDFFSAMEQYEKVLAQDPQEVKAYNNAGLIYAGGEEYTKAIEYYTRGIQVGPYYAPLYLNRALTHIKVKNYKEALLDLRKYLTIAPGLSEDQKKRLEKLTIQLAALLKEKEGK